MAAGLLALSGLVGFAAPAQAVYHGHQPADNAWPWAVRIGLVFPAGPTYCSGTLIASYAVLTASHCLIQNGQAATAINATFHYGVHPGQYSVSAQTSVKIKGEMAIIFLTPGVREPVLPLATENPTLGSQVFAGGYGCTSDPYASRVCRTPTPPKLMETSSSVVASKECPLITGPEDFCTGSRNTSINHGDSGGPVIHTKNGVVELVGVIMAIEPSNSIFPKKEYRNVFGSVTYFLAWIKDTADL